MFVNVIAAACLPTTIALPSDRLWLGRGMIVVGISLSITWMIPVFFGEFSTEPERAT